MFLFYQPLWPGPDLIIQARTDVTLVLADSSNNAYVNGPPLITLIYYDVCLFLEDSIALAILANRILVRLGIGASSRFGAAGSVLDDVGLVRGIGLVGF